MEVYHRTWCICFACGVDDVWGEDVSDREFQFFRLKGHCRVVAKPGESSGVKVGAVWEVIA